MLKRFLPGALFAAFASVLVMGVEPGVAQVPKNISQTVGVCNPSYPTRCIAVDSSGNVPITGTVTPANPTGITPTDRTITSATGASQTVMAANASRKGLTLENTGSANCGVNPTGGTAAIGGAGTITLSPLGSYTPRIPTLSAVTAICTAGQPLYASEQ